MSTTDLIKWHQKERKKVRVGSEAYWFHLKRGVMLRKGAMNLSKNPLIVAQSGESASILL